MGLRGNIDLHRLSRYLEFTRQAVINFRDMPLLLIRRTGVREMIAAVDVLKDEFGPKYPEQNYFLSSILIIRPFAKDFVGQAQELRDVDDDFNIPNCIALYRAMELCSYGDYHSCTPCPHQDECASNLPEPKKGDICLRKAPLKIPSFKGYGAEDRADKMRNLLYLNLEGVVEGIGGIRQALRSQSIAHGKKLLRRRKSLF